MFYLKLIPKLFNFPLIIEKKCHLPIIQKIFTIVNYIFKEPLYYDWEYKIKNNSEVILNTVQVLE